MPALAAHKAHPFTLIPHPEAGSRPVRAITGDLWRMPGRLRVSYVLEGDLGCLRIPAPQTPAFADDLWRHTCFEMFIARRGEPGYHELNFSPSGCWAVYRFQHYRERVGSETDAALDPKITLRRSGDKLELDAVVRLDRLSPPSGGGLLALGLSAVIEDDEGRLSYWALTHPLATPDFHHPAAFALELDEIRN